jgi:hypothetical protein
LDVEFAWKEGISRRWENALFLEHITDLILENFRGRQSHYSEDERATVVLKDNEGIYINGCQAKPGTGLFLRFKGKDNKDIFLQGNFFKGARIPIKRDDQNLN